MWKRNHLNHIQNKTDRERIQKSEKISKNKQETTTDKQFRAHKQVQVMNAHTKKEGYDDEKRRWDRTQHCTHTKQSGRLARERKKKEQNR